MQKGKKSAFKCANLKSVKMEYKINHTKDEIKYLFFSY